MTATRRFCAEDLLRFNNVNFDPLTETVRIMDELTPPTLTVQFKFLLHLLGELARIFSGDRDAI